MLTFLRKNWVWIALPLAVVLAGATLLIVLSDTPETPQPFIYNVM